MINFRALFLTIFVFSFLPIVYGMEESTTQTQPQSLEEQLEEFIQEAKTKFAAKKRQEKVEEIAEQHKQLEEEAEEASKARAVTQEKKTRAQETVKMLLEAARGKEEDVSRLTDEDLQKIYAEGKKAIEEAQKEKARLQEEKAKKPLIVEPAARPHLSPLGKRLMDAIVLDDVEKIPHDLLTEVITAGTINEQDRKGRTALWWAAHIENTSMIIQLIEAGADVDMPDNELTTPLIAILKNRNFSEDVYKVLISLINAGVDVVAKDKWDNDAICWVDSNYNYRTCAQKIMLLLLKAYLLQEGIRVMQRIREMRYYEDSDYSDNFFNRALQKMMPEKIAKRESSELNILLKLHKLNIFLKLHKGQINDQDELGATLLMYAAALGHDDIVKMLLDLKADPLVTTYAGKNVFMIIEDILNKKKQELSKKDLATYDKILKMLEVQVSKKYLIPLLSAKPEYLSKDATKVISPKYHLPPEILAQIYLHLVEQASQAKPKEEVSVPITQPVPVEVVQQPSAVPISTIPLIEVQAPVAQPPVESVQPVVVVPLATTSGDISIPVIKTELPVKLPRLVADIGRPFGEQPTPQGKPTPPAKPEWKKPFAWTAGTAFGALLARLGYNIMYPQAPSNLDKNALHAQLITALANKKYDYAVQLAQHNPESMHKLAMDSEAQHNLELLIKQAEIAIIDETVQDTTLNPFQRILQPSSSVQLQQLADLLQLLEQKA